MSTRLLACLVALVLLPACMRSRDVQKDLKLVEVRTGWYDAGIIEGGKNKLVPGISLKLQNVSTDSIENVRINAIFRRAGDQQAWGDHFVTAVGSDGLGGGATGNNVVLRSNLGYTGEEGRVQMLQNSQFVDASVEIFGKHGSRNWVSLGQFPVERKLLTE